MRPYDHLERYGTDEVEMIDIGTVHVYAKLDGTNGRVARRDGALVAGSRRREITPDDDNHGFATWVQTPENAERLHALFDQLSEGATVYGEWLVPHTLRTYREDVWRRFWLFDAHDGVRYMHQDIWGPMAEGAGLDVVPLLARMENPTAEQVERQVQANTMFIRDGAGAGEGIVLKNYAWTNKYGRQPWAKVVRNEFKEANSKLFGVPEIKGERQVEAEIALEAVTPALVAKERSKIEGETRDRRALIPRLLETVFHCVVTEELWANLKRQKFPTVDFRRLRQHCIARTKSHAKDLF